MTIIKWTGVEVAALRTALRDTQVQFADRIGCSIESVGKWERRGADITLGANYSECMDTTHGRLDDEQRGRFDAALQDLDAPLRAKCAVSPAVGIDGHLLVQQSPPVGVGPINCPAVSVDIDDDYVDTLRSRIPQLVDLDATFGGDQSSEFALQLFRSVHRKLGSVRCDPGTERELYAAAGEIGEVTGWLLYDAGEHELVRQVNNEALHLTRLAGDRSIELLTLQNMAMHAGDLGRPAEALRTARMVLETRTLSPRLEALFRIREARALAQAGDDASAKRSFRRARSLYLDGTRDVERGRMTPLRAPLEDSEVANRLEALPGWRRDGDEITRTFAHTDHECVHLAVCPAKGPRGWPPSRPAYRMTADRVPDHNSRRRAEAD